MASSTVKGLNVQITADIRGLTVGLNQATSKLKTFGQRVDKFGRSLRNSFSTIFAAGAGGAALIGPLVHFETQMNRVKAITGLTGAEFDKVRNKALLLGKETELSATEAAKGFVQLFKKGQSLSEALSGIDTVLGLVTVGEIDAAEAAKIATAAFNVFGKTGESFVSLGDKMARTSTASGVDVKDFGILISKAGATAVNAGVDFSELASTFGILRNQAVEASEAATALRNIMLRASGRSASALKELAKLKIDFFDDAGKFIGMANAMDMFNRATANLNPKALGDLSETLFGSREAGKVLGLAAAAQDIRDLTGVVNSSSGALSDFRKELLKGVSGALILMISSLKDMSISLATELKPELVAIIDKIKEFANKVSGLTPETKKLIVQIVLFSGATFIAAVAVGTLSAAFNLLFLGAIFKGLARLVWWIGTGLVASFTGANVAALGFAGTMKLVWASMLAPLLKVAGVLILVVSTFFSTLLVLEKGGQILDTVFKRIGQGIFFLVKGAFHMLAGALIDIGNYFVSLRGTKLDTFFKTMGTSAENLAIVSFELSSKFSKLRDGADKMIDKIETGESSFKKISKAAKRTREEIGLLIKETTGFDFSKIGEMIFGGGKTPTAPEAPAKGDETKGNASFLLATLLTINKHWDQLAAKIGGKKNAFSEFMKGIAADLQTFKDSLGTVQAQISQIIVSSIQSMANGIGEVFAAVAVDGKSFFKSAQEMMKNFARQFIKQVVAMIAQLLILSAAQALFNALSRPTGAGENAGAGASVAQFLGSILSSFAGFTAKASNVGSVQGGTSAGGKSKRTFGDEFGNSTTQKSQKTEQTIILELDGRQITKTVVQNMPSVVRTQSGTIRST